MSYDYNLNVRHPLALALCHATNGPPGPHTGMLVPKDYNILVLPQVVPLGQLVSW